MKTVLLAVITMLVLAGCASQDYRQYAESQTAIATAKSNAEAERYRAMALIASTGDTTTRVAAMMALQGQAAGSQAVQMAAPRSLDEKALSWLGLIVPSLGNAYNAHQQVKLGIHQSDNSTRLGISTNESFVGMAREIQAPVVATPQANINYTASGPGAVIGSGQTLSGTGAQGTGAGYASTTGSYNPTDSHSTTYPPAVVTVPAGQICTTTSTGVLSCH